MEDFLKKFKSHINEEILDLSNTQDYLADKIFYLEELNITNNDAIKHVLSQITHIKYKYNSATALEWLKYFPNVTNLECNANDLKSSSLESLKYVPNLCELHCSHNKIEVLPDINTILPKLQIIRCSHNNLVSIDISNCVSLNQLICSFNNIKTIVLHNMPKLIDLYCYNNHLTTLVLTKCKKLRFLSCDDNELTELNLQCLTNIQTIYCYSNKLNTLNISKCRFLERLFCSNNQLTSLDLSNCKQLVDLRCTYNKIQNIKKFLEICRNLPLKYFEYDRLLPFTDYQGLNKCCICLDVLNFSDISYILDISEKKISTSCGHIFHKYCLTTWLKNILIKICPYCRQLI